MKFNFVKNSITLSSNFIPTFLLLSISNRIIIPSYTIVSDNNPPHIKHVLSNRNIKQFKKDLEFLLKKHKPIDLQKLIEIKKTKQAVKEEYFHLTFNDGLSESYNIIAPILSQKGIPATFFINPSFIDNIDLMHRFKISLIIDEVKNNKGKRDKVVKFIKRKMGIRREASNFLLTLKYPHMRILNEIAQITETDFQNYLQQHQPYLTKSQINSMISDGFTFGAHSLDHPEYFMLKEEEQLRQTIESIHLTKSNLGLEYKTFAFPFTEKGVSKNIYNLLHKENNPLCDLSFGNAANKDYSNHIKRIQMNQNFSGELIIKGDILKNLFTL